MECPFVVQLYAFKHGPHRVESVVDHVPSTSHLPTGGRKVTEYILKDIVFYLVYILPFL